MISQQEPIVSEFYPDELFFKRGGRRSARMAIWLNELRLNPKSASLTIQMFFNM